MDKQKFMKMYKHNKDCSCQGSKKENSATRPIGKSAKFFMWCAVFVTVATILSMFGVAGTYAKFVSRVSSGKRTIQAAGFLIQAGNGETSTKTREIVVAPGESETVTLPIKYFSQVDTEFLNPTSTTTVTGNGILAESNWNNLLAEFATWKTTMGYSGDAPATLSDMFKVTFGNSGEDFALVLANALEAAGLSRITDNLVGRMSPSATASIDVSVNTRLEWITTSDAFDTFMGFKFSHETVVPTVNVKYGVICQQFINAENTPVRAYVDGAIKATSTDAVGQTVSEFAAANATLPTSEQCCGWFTDAALTRPAEDDMIINSSTTLYTKTATLTGLTFTDIDETTCSVGGTSASGNVVIPRTHNGKLVTAVTNSGFMNNTTMTSCTLPNSMQVLNLNSFREATTMTSCTLPNSITTMAQNCFAYAKGLSGEVYIPLKVKSIGRAAFSTCSSLTNINLPNTLKYIGAAAFQDTGLTSLNLPEGLLWIGDYAFNHCYKLQNATITIPSTVIQIGGREYVGANNENGILGTHVFYRTGIDDGDDTSGNNYIGYLKSFSVAAGNTHFVTDEYGALYTAGYKYLVAYPAGSDNTEFVMHEGCVDAFELAFSRPYKLKSVTIANSFIVRDWNSVPSNFTYHNSSLNNDDNHADGLNQATYVYCGIEEFKVKADNPNYVSHDGILYKKVAGTADSYELIAVPPKKAVGAELVIWEKCTQVNGVCWYYATTPTKIKFKTGTVIAADVIKETGKLKNSENTAIPYEFY